MVKQTSQAPKAKKKSSNKWKKRLAFWLIFILGIVAIVYISSSLSYKYVIDKYNDTSRNDVVVVDEKDGVEFIIKRGAGVSEIAAQLKEQELIKNENIFKLLSKINGYDGTYLSGTHIVNSSLTYDEMMRVLSSDPATRTVTIPEGKTFKQIVDILYDKKIIKDKAKFIRSANAEVFDYDFLIGIPKRDDRLEGYLFPDTYEYDYNASDRDILNKMLSNFNKKFRQEYREMIANLPGEMTLDKVVTMASIIEREARDPDDRYLISGVLYNRLSGKDASLRKLQVDATIQYIMMRNTGSYKDRVLYADLEIEDPYNTYLNEGLPPGPICCPGEASIKAALNPDETPYYYYVAKGDGTGSHAFAKTFKEHQANIKKYSTK
ncbi:MAG: endolytic transglycosylase MltG [Clostridiaceae bacterium]|nr:endolytic transglycosylase MltG [Clostridiaceae bacterium]